MSVAGAASAALIAAGVSAQRTSKHDRAHQARRTQASLTPTAACTGPRVRSAPALCEVQTYQGYRYVDVGGVTYNAGLKPETVYELMATNTLRGGPSADIVVATYPKCGTTWMQQVVLTLLAGGDGDKVRDPMQMSPWIEEFESVDDANGWAPPQSEQVLEPPRRVLKTHAPVQLVPWAGGLMGIPTGAKVIVVVRNPKDVAVSFFHHTKDCIEVFGYDGDWDHFLRELFLHGLLECGCFWDWHAKWYKEAQRAGDDQIMWISYEEMKADLPAAIARVASFCNIPADAELIASVAGASTFSKMQQNFAEEDAKKLAMGEFVKPNHIRQGKSGAWRKTFSGEQEAAFDALHDSKCKELGLPTDLFSFD
eukprot:CAMPEP_0117506192 /NCGR_PEP_ID=MMETSP0784-20121206/25778_1 /TAXON_ID=39447 /ORGANISM="" /LENGTH=366 /DNA_ID=CAMNT_0005301651 /DNA_START=41 /DNA_END=1141 /DNA_ORIENTATION=-